ncbi:YciI family protein [Brevundimonas sp. 2R-24]|uniref:YciI family protein n=1 Tax=Peiella sedimenti TaxID=3061083 RepID=A0ABT8SM94_9CAUL|nr:YciI family protein [Caulobacteraceae bacterium XZ-24]
MRVMVIMEGNRHTESEAQPSEALMREMMAFNEELTRAGVMLAGEGLKPTKYGKRVLFDGDKAPMVVDGPFTEAKEIVAGFWIWQVDSVEQAVEWAKRVPNTDGFHTGVQIRPIFGMEDFENITPEIIEQVNRLSAETGNYAAEKA